MYLNTKNVILNKTSNKNITPWTASLGGYVFDFFPRCSRHLLPITGALLKEPPPVIANVPEDEISG